MQNYDKVATRLKNDFYLFFQAFWEKVSSDELVLSKHIEFICKELQELGFKIINREKPDFDWLIVNVPPGSSKSTIASIMFPTWLLTNDPSLFIINTSYSNDLAVGFIRKAKPIFESVEYIDIFGKLELQKDNEGHIETKKGGGRYATSTGGTVTGVHGNVIINDDPLSVEQSYSKTFIDKANRYLLQTLSTRKRDKNITPQILIMQRLNEDDCTGHILSKGLKVKHICLPAELNPETTNPELYTNDLLDPNRMNLDVLREFKLNLGSYGYAGQFEQRPAPIEGGLIKRDWFEIVSQNEVPDFVSRNIYLDGAYTKDTKNDPTGIMVSAFYNNTLYVLNYHYDYLEMPQLLSFLPKFAEENNLNLTSKVMIEPKASGISLQQLLRQNTKLNAILINGKHVSEGKFARTNAVAPSIQAGKVKLIKGHWNEHFINEISMFPNGKHDEALDCLCYSIYDNLVKKVRICS